MGCTKHCEPFASTRGITKKGMENRGFGHWGLGESRKMKTVRDIDMDFWYVHQPHIFVYMYVFWKKKNVKSHSSTKGCCLGPVLAQISSPLIQKKLVDLSLSKPQLFF